jgi:hypothetical protein
MPCLSHLEWKTALVGNRHAHVPVSLRQVREEVRARRDHLRARNIKGEVPKVRDQESFPNTRQRFRGDV